MLLQRWPRDAPNICGFPENSRINIELLKSEHYKLAGQFMFWSVANGGPGLASLSPHAYNGRDITHPHEVLMILYDK